MVLRKSGFGAALLGSILAILHFAPGYVIMWVLGADSVPVPWADTSIEVLTFFYGVLDAGGFVVGIGAVFLLGYWAGGRLELRQQYRELLATIGLGGLLGYILMMVLVLLYAVLLGGGPFYEQQHQEVTNQGVTTVLLFIGRALGLTIQFAVVGVAGAAVAEFAAGDHRSDGQPSHPIE